MVDNSLILRKLTEIIVGILKKNLPDFEAFKAAVMSVLEPAK